MKMILRNSSKENGSNSWLGSVMRSGSGKAGKGLSSSWSVGLVVSQVGSPSIGLRSWGHYPFFQSYSWHSVSILSVR